MPFIIESIKVTAPLIAIFAVLALASPKPSLSAIFLFTESIIINGHLAIAQGLKSTFFVTSILLSLFSIVAIGSNFYFELSFKKTTTRPPKINIALGLLLVIIFWANINNFSFSQLSDTPSKQFVSDLDSLSLIICGFTLFSMLVSALTIFDIKDFRSGNST